jgi:hypothetical protein
MRQIRFVESILTGGATGVRPEVPGKKLEAGRAAIDVRLVELRPAANSDCVEVHELLDGLHSLCVIEFLKER